MNYRQPGRSALRISAIGFGCMSLGDREEEAARVIDRAVDLGINFFDTADLYEKGLNEERVGRILRGKREQVVLSTKVGNQWRADGSGWDWNPRPAYIIKAVEDSLIRLRTDRIDLYQLHGGTILDPIEETIGAFEQLQQQGKILSYGISSIRPEVIREYVQRSNIVSVMMQYSLLDRRPEESCLELLLNAGIGVLVRGAIAKGLLVDKPPAAYLNYNAGEVGKAAAAIRSVSFPRMGIREPGSGAGSHRSASQTATRFVLHHPAVTCAVVGIRTIGQVEEAAGTMETDPLTERELSMLREALPVNRYEEHR